MDAAHTTWADGCLSLWVEAFDRFINGDAETSADDETHPFAADAASVLEALGILQPGDLQEPGSAPPDAKIDILLPGRDGRPLPSPELAHAAGRSADASLEEEAPFLERYAVPVARPRAAVVSAVLERLIERGEANGDVASLTEPSSAGGAAVQTQVLMGASIRSFALVARVARHLRAQQRVGPMIMHDPGGAMSASWRPWLGDDQQVERVQLLARALPPVARASATEAEQDSMTVIESFLGWVIDETARRVLHDEQMGEALEAGRDRAQADDPHLLWLGGLLSDRGAMDASSALQSEMIKSVRQWIGALDLRGQTSAWRLGIRVEEPIDLGLEDDGPSDEETAAKDGGNGRPPIR